MKSIFLATVLLIVSNCLSAQEKDKFYFQDLNKEEQEVSDLAAGDHFLGPEVAKKLYLLKENYTWVEEATATNPVPRVNTEKPDIYYTIRKLERYYKKAIRKDQISEEKAREEFLKVIDIGLIIRNQMTDKLEATLSDLKEGDEIVSVFTNQVVIEEY